jgi:hypothetical protein
LRFIAFLLTLIGTGANPPVPVPIERAELSCSVRWERWQRKPASRYLGQVQMPRIAYLTDDYVPLGRSLARRFAHRRRRETWGGIPIPKPFTQAELLARARMRTTPDVKKALRFIRYVPRRWRVYAFTLLLPVMMGAAGTHYYVDPVAGNDGDSGLSTALAKATIGAAISACANGDFINLMGGGALVSFATSTTRSSVIVQNYNTDDAIIQATHGGSAYTNNAGIVMSFTGAWTNCTIRGNPAGGSLTIRHVGTPSMAGYTYTNFLAVGNTNMTKATGSYSGIRFAGGSGNTIQDLWVNNIFGYGINLNNSDGAIVQRCTISGTASGIWTNADSVTIQDNDIADNQYMLRSGSEEDTGSNGIQLSGASNWIVTNNDIHGNWSFYGSQQFGGEGGAVEYFDIVDGTGGATIGNRCWDNHGFMESGVGQGHSSGWSGGGVNAEIAYNTVFGHNDYQIETSGLTQPLGGTSAGPNAPTTPFILIRAIRDTEIHHNTFDVDNGSADNSGIRSAAAGGFAGVQTGNIIRDNIFRVRFATPVYNFNGGGLTVVAGISITNNTIYYTFDRGTGNAFASTGTANDYNLAEGPAQAFADLGLCSGDVWGDTNTNQANSDPDFVDATNPTLTLRNYHLLASSPCRGTAHDGSDRGSLGFVNPLPAATGSDTLTVSDATTRGVGRPRTGTDAMTASDSSVRSIAKGRVPSDALTTSDSASSAGKVLNRFPVGP